MKSPFEIVNGQKHWSYEKGDQYLITGVTLDGKRFRTTYSSWQIAKCINLWSGHKWLVRDGKRYLIQRA